MSEERYVLSTLITMLRESFPEGNLGNDVLDSCESEKKRSGP